MAFDDQMIMKAFTCFWTINDFSKCKPNINLSLKSQVFKTTEHSNSKWHLEINQEDSKTFGIDIVFDGGPRNILLNFSIFLRTNLQWMALSKKSSYDFYNTHSTNRAHKIIEWEKVNSQKWKFLPNKSLTICVVMFKPVIKSSQCYMISKMINEKDLAHTSVEEYSFLKPSDFITFTDPTPSQFGTKETEIKGIQTTINYNFEDFGDLIRFFEEKKFELVTLRSGDKMFSAHKGLLCAKSSVFNDIFKTESDKENIHLVDMDDIDSDTLAFLLQFLHLESLKSDLKLEEILKLFHAAKMYQIKHLAEKCAVLLKENLSAETLYQAFDLADHYDDENLKQYAMEYFCDNSKVILRSSEWKDFMLKKTELVPEILCKLAEKL